ncbi:MAG: Bax inhibitor-1 family protein [Candidatus Nanohaloarchaea archaeon]
MKHEYKTIGIASGLVALNIALMSIIAFTPLAGVMEYVFSYLILGVLFFGALLTGGVWIAKSGIRNNNKIKSGLGVGILQIAYGLFGGGVLSMAPANLMPIIIGTTFVATLGLTIASAALVYFTGRDFSSFDNYSTYMFLGVLGLSLFGTFLPYFRAIAFFLALAGFLTYLIYEIYVLREQQASPLMNGLGIYVAFMGVFIQILQMVLRYYLEE